MKKILAVVGLFALACTMASASSVNWNWPAATGGTEPTVGYNLYEAPTTATTCTSYTGGVKVNTSLITQTTYSQTTVPTTAVCAWVTAVSASGVEGTPSPLFRFTTAAPGQPGRPNAVYVP